MREREKIITLISVIEVIQLLSVKKGKKKKKKIRVQFFFIVSFVREMRWMNKLRCK